MDQIVNKPQIDSFVPKEPIKKKPLVSVIVPVYNIKPKWLDLCINSVLNQIFENWELSVYNDGSTIKSTIDALRKWEGKDKRIKIRSGKSQKGISIALNEAVKMSSGEYIALLDNVDELTDDALLEVAEKIISIPNLKFIYSDESIVEKIGSSLVTYYKPDFNFDLFLSSNYISHLTVVKKSLGDTAGWFRRGYEGAYDYDFLLRVLERVKSKNIFHIPKVLYRYREKNEQPQKIAMQSSIKALKDYIKRNKIDGQVLEGRFQGTFRIKRNIQKKALVSIIIPFKDKVELLENCVDSLLTKTEYNNFEILLINNMSKNRKTHQYLESIIKRDRRVLRYDYNYPFNFSAINNWAVQKSKGKYILFLNNDTEVISREWLSAMVEHIQRKEVGAVGAKLLYKNDIIQHAGIVLTLGASGEHIFRDCNEGDSGYFGQLNLIRNCSACTGACLMVKRSLFEKIGGFDEIALKIAYNDVDLCLKIRENDYLIVYTPYAELYHYESHSRGYDDTPKKIKIARKEINHMQKRWKGKILKDPYYNPNLMISSTNSKVTSTLEQLLKDKNNSQYVLSMKRGEVRHNTGETNGNKHYCFTTKHKKGNCVYVPEMRLIKSFMFRATFFIEFINIFEEEEDLISLYVYEPKHKKVLISKNIFFQDLKSMKEQFVLEFKGAKSQVLALIIYWNKTCDIAVSKIVLEKM
jgi:O-antigen biosynthesis protein